MNSFLAPLYLLLKEGNSFEIEMISKVVLTASVGEMTYAKKRSTRS